MRRGRRSAQGCPHPRTRETQRATEAAENRERDPHEAARGAGARFFAGRRRPGPELEIILASQDSNALKGERGRDRAANCAALPISVASSRPRVSSAPEHGTTGRRRAAERGVTTQAIGETMASDQRRFRCSLAKINLDSRQIAIRVQVPPAVAPICRRSPACAYGSGWLVPLDSVADVVSGAGRRRSTDTTASGRSLSRPTLPGIRSVTRSRGQEAADGADLAIEREVGRVGDAEFMGELFGSFGLAMLTGVLCVYCVLVLLFRDWSSRSRSCPPCRCHWGARSWRCCSAAANWVNVADGLVCCRIVTKNSILLASTR